MLAHYSTQNPLSSRLYGHDCFPAWGLYKQALWMKHWGHMCLKRTLLWSTSPKISKLNLGPIQKGQHKSLVKTAEKYKDKQGKDRYKGTGKALKGTQFLDCICMNFFFYCGGLFKCFRLGIKSYFPPNISQLVVTSSETVSCSLRWEDSGNSIRALGNFTGLSRGTWYLF